MKRYIKILCTVAKKSYTKTLLPNHLNYKYKRFKKLPT